MYRRNLLCDWLLRQKWQQPAALLSISHCRKKSSWSCISIRTWIWTLNLDMSALIFDVSVGALHESCCGGQREEYPILRMKELTAGYIHPWLDLHQRTETCHELVERGWRRRRDGCLVFICCLRPALIWTTATTLVAKCCVSCVQRVTIHISRLRVVKIQAKARPASRPQRRQCSQEPFH